MPVHNGRGGQILDATYGSAAAEYAVDDFAPVPIFTRPNPLSVKVKYLKHKLYRTKWWACYWSDGTISKVPAATMGNKTYAVNRQSRIDSAVKALTTEKTNSVLWFTITRTYKKNENGRIESWKYFHDELPALLRIMRCLGMTSYIRVFEAHRDGGCHCHIAAEWDRKFETFEDSKGKLRITCETFRQAIKNCWAGHVDIQVARDGHIGGYLTKEMGKGSHIEEALKRADKNWEGSKEETKANDLKKIQAIYYASKLKIRMITTSRNLPAVDVPDEEPPCDLITSKNNPTEKKVLEEVIEIPADLKIWFNFDIYTGEVAPATELYNKLLELRYRPPPDTENEEEILCQ